MRARLLIPALCTGAALAASFVMWPGDRPSTTGAASPEAGSARPPAPYGNPAAHQGAPRPAWDGGEVASKSAAGGQHSVVAPEVTERLRTDGLAPVIVTLRVKPAGPAPGRAPDLGAARASIAAASTRVLSAVPAGELRQAHSFEAIPAIAGVATAAGVQALAAQPDVAHIGLSRSVHAELAEAVPLIGADDVQGLGITGDGVTVAVFDTGIDTDHPLLADDVAFQQCFLFSLEGGLCAGGFISGPTAEDDFGHGSHVSGIITSNGPPIGVAPDAKIGAVKVLDANGSGDFINILLAYDYIINQHPEVDEVNMSLGDGGSYPPGACEGIIPAMTAAVSLTRAMGITTFAASGNNGSKSGIGYPACINDIVAVGATYDADIGPGACGEPTAADVVTCFSQSGAGIDLLAPGSAITSTVPGGGLATFDGTSMASPMAAGVAALLLQSEPGLTPGDVEARLTATGVPVFDPGNGVTACRVDAYEAIINDGGAVCETTVPPPPANDNLADAVVIPEPLPYTNTQFTLGATNEPGEPAPCGAIASTVWYAYTPSADRSVLLTTNGSSYDTVLAVYDESGGSPPGALGLIGCNDDASGLQSRLLADLTGGVTYFIQAGGFFGAAGSLQLNLSELIEPTCPATPAFSFAQTDGLGDAFGFGNPNHDIMSITGEGDATLFCLTVEFVDTVGPSDGDFSLAVVGAVDFDTDQSASTGFQSTLDVFCPTESNMAIEATLSLFGLSNGLTFMGETPVFVDFTTASSFTAKIPLEAIGGDDAFNFGMVLGSQFEPTDCAPADGGCYEAPTGAVCVPPPPPANDDLVNAIVIPEPLPYTNTQTTLGATLEAGEPQPCNMSKTVWYQFTPAADTFLVADTLGSSFDTVLAIFDTLGSPPGSLRLLECNDQFGGNQSRVTTPLTSGTTYYIQAGGYEFGGIRSGDLTLNAYALPPADCPEGNDGFEAGLVDDDDIPCWLTENLPGGAGSWCTQAGGTAPQGACAGSGLSVAAPPEGTQAAMTGQFGPGSHVLYRCGFLGSGTVSFELYLNNTAAFITDPSLDYNVFPNQQFRADLVTAAGTALDPFTTGGDVLLNLYQTQPGDPTVSGYTTVSTDTNAYVGQEVCLRFAEVDNQNFFHAGVDAVDVVLGEEIVATPTPTSTATPTATPTPSGPCGDVDGDGVVTEADIDAIVAHLGRRRFDAQYDVNGDGRVTGRDVLIAARQLGSSC